MLQRILHFKYLPAVLIALIVVTFVLLKYNKPSAKRRPPPATNTINIETETIQQRDISVSLQSYGIVRPRTQSTLIAEVSGRVIFLSDKFRDGGFFEKGDVLIELDDADYLADIALTKADLATAETDYEEELAQADQAKQDWQRLNGNIPAPSLVLREPQKKAAQTRVESAKANLDRAILNYQRTKIKAPFDGRVLTKNIDLGQFATINSQVGNIYATDAVEITLPIKNAELALIDLPENYRDSTSVATQPSVEIQSSLYPKETWLGKIVRTASAIDDITRQLSVTALIKDPFGEIAQNRSPLKIGEYVTANIIGKTLNNAIAIPNRSIYQGSYVYVFRDNAVHRTDISIYWQNEQEAIISSGLTQGEILVLTPLGQVSSGTPAKDIHSNSSPNNTSQNSPDDISTWLAQLPTRRLEKLKERAKKENKTVEEIAQVMRKQRKDKN